MSSTTTINIDELTAEFRCVHCTAFMHPPIHQCAHGHTLCHRCHHRLRTCPTCRTLLLPHRSSRAYVLERIHAKLRFPCRFTASGCTERTLPGPLVHRHEYSCRHGGTACPLSELNSCTWRGRAHQLVAHCQAAHRKNIFLANVQQLTCYDFKPATTAMVTTTYYILFYAFRHFFKCIWEVDFETGLMKWCVYKLTNKHGASEKEESFDFFVEVIDLHSGQPGLTITGLCPELYPEEQQQREQVEDYVLMHCNMVQKFCIDGELTYVVKIFPTDVAVNVLE